MQRNFKNVQESKLIINFKNDNG